MWLEGMVSAYPAGRLCVHVVEARGPVLKCGRCCEGLTVSSIIRTLRHCMRGASLLSSFRLNNQQDASSIRNFILSRNSTCFGHLLCPSSGVIGCTRGNWYVSCRLCGLCLGESGWSSVPLIRSYQLYTWQLVCFMQVMWPLPRGVKLEFFCASHQELSAVHVAIGMFHAGYVASA
jgi:hypothetical protein